LVWFVFFFFSAPTNISLPEGVSEGELLATLRAFSQELPPELRGETLQGMDAIREAHNSFARAEPFLPEDDRREKKSGEAFHFAAYVPFRGRVLELDGLKPGPIDHGPVLGAAEGGWTAAAANAIRARFSAYEASELRFTLLAVCRDRRVLADEGIRRASDAWMHAEARHGPSHSTLFASRLLASPAGGAAAAAAASILFTPTTTTTTTTTSPSPPPSSSSSPPPPREETERRAEQARALRRRHQWEEVKQEAERRREAWARETRRRRHNWVPFLVEAFTIAAEHARVDDWVRAAEQRADAIRAARTKAGAAAEDD
jgi:Ubiquitin carboxyl-terminal hydrolase, family 1/Ubiquitin carboxyl-terminal hydrolases